MRATSAAVVAPRTFELIERDLTPGLGQVLIRVSACGICHSEMKSYLEGPASGRPPLLLGHEAAGEIVEVGPGVDGFAVGNRVSGLFSQAFGTHTLAESTRIIPVPATLPDEQALLEPIKCVVTAARGAACEFGDYVVLVGCGYMGLLVLSCLRGGGARQLIGIDVDPTRLELARAFGATAVVDARGGRLAVEVAVRELTGGRMADVAIEAAGNAAALELACNVLRQTRPKLVMVGFHNRPQMVDLTDFAVKGLILHVTHPSYSADQMEDLRRALWAVETGVIPAGRLVTHRYPLSEIGPAFEAALAPRDGFVKGMVVM
ncbi:MAG: alcohol dehydrogenase catalytic domain-containing protein [Chloroflexi bacterium]|nr:alcohol dehydrogenase catalytic domain-containing protein [Chloroflexota bacterium]